MTTALIIFGISLLATSMLLWSKQKELVSGKPALRIGSPSLDARIVRSWNSLVYLLTHVTASSLRAFAHRLVVRAEKSFIRLFHYLTRRFVSAGHVITGHNIPKNRGSASFFLKNIEEHKRSSKSV